MKTIAVIVNNRREWLYFVDTLQFTLSKENKPYNTVAKAMIDIEKKVKYVEVLNHVSGIESIRGYLWDDYITMGKQVDKELENWIKLHMRGEE
jgi:hypothetical protein